MKFKTTLIAGLVACFGAQAELLQPVQDIQKRWAVANYQTNEDAREDAFEKLAADATRVREANPGQAESWIWEGIVYSTYAGVKGGLGAIKLAKHAKKAYEEALKIDPAALNGSAYTSLGVLYYKVPGWPLGFGSDKKANELLLKGLEYNPDGIDSNFFYGEFLYDEEGEYAQARVALMKAAQAAPRPGREVADAGRQAEIQRALAEVNDELD